MFYNAASFNRPLNGWSLNQVTNMMAMFAEATAFNQDLSAWSLDGVADAADMRSGARRLLIKTWGGASAYTALGVFWQYKMLQS